MLMEVHYIDGIITLRELYYQNYFYINRITLCYISGNLLHYVNRIV